MSLREVDQTAGEYPVVTIAFFVSICRMPHAMMDFLDEPDLHTAAEKFVGD